MAFEKDKPMDAPFEHVGLTKPHGGPYDVAVPELLRGACDDYVRNLGRLVVAVSRRLSAAGDAIEPQRLPTRFEFIRRLYTATGDVLDTSMADMLRQALLRALQDGLKRVAGRIAAQLPKPVSVVDILFTAEMRASGLMAKVELLGVDGMRLMVRARAELMRSNVKKTVYAKLIELKQDMSMLSWFEIQRRINSFEDELVAQLDGSFVQYSGTNERLRTYVEHFAASGLRELEQQVPLYAKAEFRAAAPQQRPSNKQAMTGDAKPTTTTTTTTTTTNAKAQQQAGTSSGEATATGNEGITGAGAPARNDAAPIAEPFREPSRKNVAQLSEVTRGGTNIVGGRKTREVRLYDGDEMVGHGRHWKHTGKARETAMREAQARLDEDYARRYAQAKQEYDAKSAQAKAEYEASRQQAKNNEALQEAKAEFQSKQTELDQSFSNGVETLLSTVNQAMQLSQLAYGAGAASELDAEHVEQRRRCTDHMHRRLLMLLLHR